MLDRANRKKWNRFTWSGLIILLVGLLLVIYGVQFMRSAYSAEVLVVGAGVIIVIVGIIRVLIGIINPALPSDLYPIIEAEQPQPDLMEQEPETGSL